jgi:hypothetical protein
MKTIFENIKFAFQLIWDAIKNKEILELWREQVFLDKVVIPVFVDLTALPEQKDPFQDTDYEFVELNPADLRSGKWTFLTPGRRYRALYRIKRGLRCFALLKDTTIVGDMCSFAPHNPKTYRGNREFEQLGIPFTGDDAIAADMHIDPAYRGKKLAIPMHLSLELILKRDGRHRLYSFYYEENLLAKPMHWILKVKELPKFHEARFFRFKKYRYTSTDPSGKKAC